MTARAAGTVRVLSFIASLCILIASFSCRFRTAAEGESEQWTAGRQSLQAESSEGLVVDARLPDYITEIEKRFHLALPDSGILPLVVSITNRTGKSCFIEGPRPTASGYDPGGLEVTSGSDTLRPLHPEVVLQRMRGLEEPPEFNGRSRAGSIALALSFPPVAPYVGAREIRENRYLRPLFEHSLLDALPAGVFAPIPLSPGETAVGYLYLPHTDAWACFESAPSGENAVSGDGETAASDRERAIPKRARDALRRVKFAVRGSHFTAEIDSLPGSSMAYLSGDGSGVAFAIRRDREFGGRGRLLYGAAKDILGPASVNEPGLESFRSKQARVAGAGADRSHIVCAVNYRSRSELFGYELEGAEPAATGSIVLRRPVIGLWVESGRVIAVTKDAVCHVVEPGTMKRKKYFKLGNDVVGAGYADGSLFVLGSKRLSRFDPLSGRRAGEIVLPSADRSIIGTAVGGVAVLNRAAETRQDTLVVFPAMEAAAPDIVPLPGRVIAARACTGSVIFQLEGGRLLRIALDDAGKAIRIEEAFLSFETRAIHCDGEWIAAFGVGDEFSLGTIDDFRLRPGRVWSEEVSLDGR